MNHVRCTWTMHREKGCMHAPMFQPQQMNALRAKDSKCRCTELKLSTAKTIVIGCAKFSASKQEIHRGVNKLERDTRGKKSYEKKNAQNYKQFSNRKHKLYSRLF